VIQLAFLRIYRKYLLWLSSLAHIGFNFSRIRCWPSMSETYSSFVGFTFIFFGVFLFFFFVFRIFAGHYIVTTWLTCKEKDRERKLRSLVKGFSGLGLTNCLWLISANVYRF